MMIRRGPVSLLRQFLKQEAAGGLLLIGAAALALIVANGPLGDTYRHVLHLSLGPLDLHGWINDALMALFFLGVGLEIKREVVAGHLANPADRALPIVAAAGGMIVPAVVYLAVAGHVPGLVRGWAIPAATDIAFALGVLALLGRRVPASLKLFLTTLAIVDDMGAVAIIAVAYTDALNGVALACAAALFGAMLWLNRRGVRLLAPYLLLAVALWVAVFLSGIHATVAGVLAALAIPIRGSRRASPLHRLEHALHPWIAYAIVPLFGFANAGVSFAGLGWRDMVAPLPLGVAAGLFLGKQIGVFAAIRLGVAAGIGQRPAGANWGQLYGVSLLAGIGFTMSLFIGGLAFSDGILIDEVKLGVLAGSLAAALGGVIVLMGTGTRKTSGSEQ